MAQPPGLPGFLAHRDGDLVGVAVRDLDPGPADGGYLAGPGSISVRINEAVPLGQTMAEHIDLDCAGLLRRQYDLSAAGLG